MRKQNKRDKNKTEHELKDAVSKLLRTKGYPFVKTGEVSREIDKDKGVIRHHYRTFDNLVKAFITERDYWSRLFEDFVSKPDVSLMEKFITMMQDNLEIFRSDEEMQRIIRWQISEENPLLKEISDAREESGEELMALAESHFNGTGIHLPAILAMILGGSYYLVLRSATNKSVVCGIDVHNKKDWDAFTGTIRQIIEWAWNAAQS